MVPYSKISSKLIKTYNLYLDTDDAKRFFLNRFSKDEKSFNFLKYLVRYCAKKTQGEWPEKITPEILNSMEKDSGSQIQIEETKIYKDGYLIKNNINYELTHEFIVSAFICCSDGNFLPLSTGHIDFSNEEKIATFLQNEVFIQKTEVVTFLMKLLDDMSKTPGVLMGRSFNIKRAMEIAKENNLVFDLCMIIAQKFNILYVNIEEERLECNALVFLAYLASPKLN